MALRRLGEPSSETCNTMTMCSDQRLVQPNDNRSSVSQLPYVIPTTTLNVVHFLHSNIVRLIRQLASSTTIERVQKFCPDKNRAPASQHSRTAISTSSPLCKRHPPKRYCSGPNYRVDSSEVPNETTAAISCVRCAVCGGPLP